LRERAKFFFVGGHLMGVLLWTINRYIDLICWCRRCSRNFDGVGHWRTDNGRWHVGELHFWSRCEWPTVVCPTKL